MHKQRALSTGRKGVNDLDFNMCAKYVVPILLKIWRVLLLCHGKSPLLVFKRQIKCVKMLVKYYGKFRSSSIFFFLCFFNCNVTFKIR